MADIWTRCPERLTLILAESCHLGYGGQIVFRFQVGAPAVSVCRVTAIRATNAAGTRAKWGLVSEFPQRIG